MSDAENNPDKIINQIAEPEQAFKGRVPPGFDQWNPPLSGDMDLIIKSNGVWLHEGDPIRREPLVRLFSTILRRENDGSYYLVTPVEKWRIKVEKAPFLVVDFQCSVEGDIQCIKLKTNIGEWFIADKEHPLIVGIDPSTQEPMPIIRVRDQLDGLLTRAVFYHLTELAEEGVVNGQTCYGIWSCGEFFRLE